MRDVTPGMPDITGLDARLTAVAQAVRPGARVADVGCDHGRLICALAACGRIPGGVACDLREGPLQGARTRIREMGLEGKIDARLCDGLSGVRPEEADDIVVAGMGGETIAGILSGAQWLRDEKKSLVLQPQTKEADLRRWLWGHGFEIRQERGVRAGRFAYLVMTARYCGVRREADDWEALVGLLPGQEDAGAAAVLRLLARRLRRAGEGAGDRRLIGWAERLENGGEKDESSGTV